MAVSCTTSCWRIRGLLALCLVIVVPVSLKARDLMASPACDAASVTDTVREIFKSFADEKVTVDRIATVASGRSSLCRAHVESTDENADIVYSIGWQDRTPVVHLEKVVPLTGPRAEGVGASTESP